MTKLFLRCALGLLIVAVCSVSADALVPNEVLVVANTNSIESVELGKYYAQQRGIPDQNIALIQTTSYHTIKRKDYDSQIRAPLRQILLDRNLATKIRCLVVMWGVPIQVLEPPASAPRSGPATTQTAFEPIYRTAATKAHYRLAVDYKLLGSVCNVFPEPQTEMFKPLGKLFKSPIQAPNPPLMEYKALLKDIYVLLGDKQIRLLRIRDHRKQRIASRQLMGLHLDIGGLNGLINFVETAKPPDAPAADYLKKLLKEAERQLNLLRQKQPSKQNIKAQLILMDTIAGASLVFSYARDKSGGELETMRERKPAAKNIINAADASVDSELALLWLPKDYKLTGPLTNPLHWQMAAKLKGQAPPVLMTARIDGPTANDAKRIISSSISTEKLGLRGKFYIDAGGKYPPYDEHLRKLYKFVTTHTKIETIFDEQKAVFRPNSCPDASLYVGWYSLKKYVPAFTWTNGAVGWHVSSWEAQQLRDPAAQTWCPKMIQNGVAATLGAVTEPTLNAFPNPEEFFPLLLTGKYTLAECYWRTIRAVSWKMMLIGDPLYKPFAVNPQVSVDVLPKGLAP